MTTEFSNWQQVPLYSSEQVCVILGISGEQVDQRANGCYDFDSTVACSKRRRRYSLIDVLRLAIGHELGRCGFESDTIACGIGAVQDQDLRAWSRGADLGEEPQPRRLLVCFTGIWEVLTETDTRSKWERAMVSDHRGVMVVNVFQIVRNVLSTIRELEAQKTTATQIEQLT